MEILKEHEEFLDKIALEMSKVYMTASLPTSDTARSLVATAAYKQALATLDVKLGLEAILKKSPYLVKQRVKEINDKKQ